MGADDDDCGDHHWVLVGRSVSLWSGTADEYICRACGALSFVMTAPIWAIPGHQVARPGL